MKYKISVEKIKTYIGEKEYNDLRCVGGKSIIIRAEKRLARDSKDRNFINLGA
jgi:hypothetical protein